MPTILCQTCGKPFEVEPSRESRTKYCSKKCSGLRADCVTLSCKTCGNTYKARASRKATSKYCSRKCHDDRLEPTYTSCKTCNKLIKIKPCLRGRVKYCSKACQWIGVSGPRPGRVKVTTPCMTCCRPFEIKQCQKGRSKYCSIECYRMAQWQGCSDCISGREQCHRCRDKVYELSKTQQRFSVAVSTAVKKRHIPFTISKTYYESLMLLPCYYCDRPLDPMGVGLDRIDNDKSIGYTRENVVPCCGRCNCTRGDRFTFEEMCIIGESIRRIDRERELMESLPSQQHKNCQRGDTFSSTCCRS